MRVSPIFLAVSATMGVMCAALVNFKFSLILFFAYLVGIAVWAIKERNINLSHITLAFLFIISSISYTISVSAYLHKSVNYINRYVTLCGTLISASDETSNDCYRYIFRVKSISDRYGTQKANDNILFTTPHKFNCGESLKIKGIIRDLPHQMNESGFNPTTYYRSNNIFTRIYSEDATRTKSIFVFSPLMVSECISERVDKMIYRHYRDDGAAILSAVLTGNKHRFSEEYDDVLVSTGFKKVFHPAYLHIFIITSLIGLFRYVIRRQYRDLSTAVILLIYALIQCSSIGFTRCLVCTAIIIYYRLRYGSSYFPDAISVVIVICALTMPTMLFNTSFIISVLCGLIAWAFIPKLYKKLGFIPKPLRRTVSAMIIFGVFATPVMAYFFSSICIYSFFLPLITAPVILLILLICPVYFIMQALLGMAPIIGAYLNASVKYLYKLPYIISGLPFSSVNIGKASASFMIMSLCVILSIYYADNSRRSHTQIFKTLAAGFFTAIVFSNLMRIGTAEINFVNVGQGDGAVIHTPYKETVIIDAGGSSEFSEYNTGKELFVPYLYAMGINHIEAIVVSHYHKDHAEGVINVMQSIRTDAIFMPPITDADSESMKELAKEIKNTALRNGTKVRYITENTQISFKDGLTLEIYRQPEWIRKYDENNTSLPVMVRYGKFSALFMGDMTGMGESEFVKYADADADVLKVSHHGSRDSTCQEFIDEVSPQISVISCSEDNLYGHPHTETLDRLRNTSVLRTDLMGDIRISARKSGKYKVLNATSPL